MNNLHETVVNNILLFVSHPCADMIRDHFKQKALVYGYLGEEVYPYIPEEQESEEEDDSEYDYDAHCDCCVELWEDCQC